MSHFILGLALFLAILPPARAQGSTVQVGGTDIVLPAPVGFVVVGDELPEIVKIGEASLPPDNRLVAMAVTEADHRAMLARQEAAVARYILVQVPRRIEKGRHNSKFFAALKTVIGTQNEKILAQVKNRLPDVMNYVTGKLGDALDRKVRAEIPEMTPLPAHREGDRSFSYSMYIKLKMEIEGEDATEDISAATLTGLHVRGKILFLYVYGTKSDLEWTRTASADWSDAILAANGSN